MFTCCHPWVYHNLLGTGGDLPFTNDYIDKFPSRYCNFTRQNPMVYHGLSWFIMVYHLKYPSKPWKISSFPQIFRSRRATRKRWSVWCGANTRRPCRRHLEVGGSREIGHGKSWKPWGKSGIFDDFHDILWREFEIKHAAYHFHDISWGYLWYFLYRKSLWTMRIKVVPFLGMFVGSCYLWGQGIFSTEIYEVILEVCDAFELGSLGSGIWTQSRPGWWWLEHGWMTWLSINSWEWKIIPTVTHSRTIIFQRGCLVPPSQIIINHH